MATDYNEETFVRDIYQVKKGHHITINESFEEKTMVLVRFYFR